jgi:hypothetical protein
MDPELAAALAAINHKLDAQQPFLDGIPLLGKSIEILQRDVQTLRGDVRILRDDLHVTSAMAMRVDTTLSSLVAEFSAIHRWMSGVNSRLRELEGKP